MKTGLFYFLTDSYYKRFANCGLVKNKTSGKRPCYYCLELDGFFWMIPISSKIEKYEAIYEKNNKKYRNYFGIRFGYVNGKRSAFLLQNICPVTSEYIDSVYKINKGQDFVRVNSKTDTELLKAAKQILRLNANGIKVTLSDIDTIMNELEQK